MISHFQPGFISSLTIWSYSWLSCVSQKQTLRQVFPGQVPFLSHSKQCHNTEDDVIT